MRQAYRRFLSSSSIDTWWACLNTYATLIDDSLDGQAIAEGLCISYYVQWLSAQSGDTARGEQAAAVSKALRGQLERLHRQAPSSATRRAWAFALAWRGYDATARSLVADQDMGPEFLLMTAPTDPAARAAELRPHASGPNAPAFPLVRIVYCSALMDIGALGEAEDLLAASDVDLSNPLVRDLIGSGHERAGRWAEACAVYDHEGARWPAHRYRAALCRIIAGEAEARTHALGPLLVDDAVSEAMSRFDSEIDQAEVARSMSFVNACLWSAFDDWMVHYELGKLDFRRRRYSEADAHLRKAVRAAPTQSKRVIAGLRFTSLTWLSDRSLTWPLSMTPEALEAGVEALEHCDSADQLTQVRVWVAAEMKQKDLEPHPLDTALGLRSPPSEEWDAYDRGRVHHAAGDQPEALACWLEGLRDGFYHHRNVFELVTTLSSARFALSSDYLVQLIIRESADDFFALWELAELLLVLRGGVSESSADFERLSTRLATVVERMLELSQFEFQHLIRAHEFFVRANRQDAAEALLRRAAGLADSPAEKLAVAVARRTTAWFASAEGDPEVVSLLEQAEEQSRDRLERLLIAGELFHHGRLQRARSILEQERLFESHAVLDHAEYVAGLRCGPWLKPEEVEALLSRALDALERDVKTGVIRRFGRLYFRRLITVVALTDPALAERMPRRWSLPESGPAVGGDAQVPELDAGPWRAWRDSVTACEDPQGRMEMLLDRIRGFATGDFEEKLATWVWLQRGITAALDAALTARPRRPQDLMPISKTLSLEDDPRVLELCDLWRGFLVGADSDERGDAMQRIVDLEAREAELRAEWARLRQVDAEGELHNALVFLDASIELAHRFDAGEMHEAQPILAELQDRVAEDARRLAVDLSARAEALRLRAAA